MEKGGGSRAPVELHSQEQEAGSRAPKELWNREQGTEHMAREQGAGGVEKQGVGEASEERGLHASYNTTSDQPAPAMIKNRSDNVGYGPSMRSGESSGPPMRPGLPVAIGPTKTTAQPRLQTQYLTSSADAFSGLWPENQHKGADGNTPSGGRPSTALPMTHSSSKTLPQPSCRP